MEEPVNITAINQSLFNATNCTTKTPYFCPSGKAWRITVLSLLVLCSLVGNILFTAVFFKSSELRSAVNYLVVNMAISDLVYPVFVLPWRMAEIYLNHTWIIGGTFGAFLCKFLPFLEQTSVNVSILSMVIIGVERFHSVIFALRPTLVTVKKCSRIIAAIWMFSVATCVHYFYAWKLEKRPLNDCLRCHFRWNTETDTTDVYIAQVIVYYILLSALPWALLTVLYSCIIFTLFRQKGNMNLDSKTRQQRENENKRVTCMVLTVLIAFVTVWTPHYVNLALFFFVPELSYNLSCSTIFVMNYLRYTYITINPLVYFVFSERYRSGLKQLFYCLRLKISFSRKAKLLKITEVTSVPSVGAYEFEGRSSTTSKTEMEDHSMPQR